MFLTAICHVLHVLFPHYLLKSKQCMNASHSHDLLLISVPDWWRGEFKVLPLLSPILLSSPKKKMSSYIRVAMAMWMFWFFCFCGWVILLCFPRVLPDSLCFAATWLAQKASLQLTRTNAIQLACVMQVMCWSGATASSCPLRLMDSKGSCSCSSLQDLTACVCPLTSWTASCVLKLQTTVETTLYKDKSSVLSPVACGCRRPALLLCCASSLFW